MFLSSFFFYLISFFVICSGIGILSASNPVHSIFFLVCVFLNVSILFLFLNVEFIAMIFLIIYVGAIAILFLFVVMMLNIKAVEYQQTILRYIPITSFLCFTFFFQTVYLVYVGFNNSFNIDFSIFIESLVQPKPYTDWYDLYFSVENIKILGSLLFTYYFIPFLICGLILLVAMIASIVLTLTKEVNTKRQELFKQLLRNSKKTIELKKKLI